MSGRDSLFVEHPIDVLQCNPSIVATIQAFGKQNFVLYRGVTLLKECIWHGLTEGGGPDQAFL